ncbi:MAG: nicotinate-nucleotide--dimethylbenzimidazole phosphoribosyltransferase [Steroidobacteraceae bacterium]
MSIPALDVNSQRLAEQRQAQLIKPGGALGRLEDIACWFAARQGREIPQALQPAITVFAADHGVACQGVSAYPQSVTAAMLGSLANGQAAIAVLARELNAIYAVVDVGVISNRTHLDNLHIKRIAQGTHDLSATAAMSTAQATLAMQVGAEQAQECIKQGANLLIAGEVGIGNTTAAACLTAALTGLDAALIVGTGTGLDQQGRQHKLAIVRQALARGAVHEPLGLLAELGGFEIAAMSGFYLQSIRMGVPVLLDGFIATAAALLACAMEPAARDWMLAAHQSAELGHALALEHLCLKPLLHLNLRLGEGSGAALAVPLLQSALRLHRDMATFAEAGVAGGSN